MAPTYPAWPKGWNSRWLVAGGRGALVTFASDVGTGSGEVWQLGVGRGLGAGLRLMDLSVSEEKTGREFDVRTYMGYFGLGAGRGPGNTGFFMGAGLGATHLEGSGEDDHGLAAGFNLGVCKYRDFARHGGFGVAAEAGLFLSEAADIPLYGMTFTVGAYAYF